MKENIRKCGRATVQSQLISVGRGPSRGATIGILLRLCMAQEFCILILHV